jgi:four helix bundle protein
MASNRTRGAPRQRGVGRREDRDGGWRAIEREKRLDDTRWVLDDAGTMSIIRSFRDLNVYRTARQEAQIIFVTSRGFPAEERYALTDQIRRSSRAVKAMIAEAWGRRKYQGVFVNKIDEALGEANETQSWLDDCLDSGYISPQEYARMDSAWQSVGAMLNKMIDKSEGFCRNSQK